MKQKKLNLTFKQNFTKQSVKKLFKKCIYFLSLLDFERENCVGRANLKNSNTKICMCVRVEVCMHACMRTCVDVFMCVCMLQTCMYACLFVRMYVCTYEYTHTYACRYVYMGACMRVCKYELVYECNVLSQHLG